ncbi:ATP-binding protein [Massilia sp. W12]|uniref:ATP-binding protein n=1 Tax=Massilia sp. W12 TaxID=3126507 RepID=UPI0030D2F1B7
MLTTPVSTLFAALLPDWPQHAMLRRILLLRLFGWTCQLLALLAAWRWLGLRMPSTPFAALILLALASIAATIWRMRQPRPLSEGGLFLQFLLDLLLYGGLLYLSGGATNPFVSFLLALLALAAAILPPRRTALLAALAVGMYALLWRFYLPLELGNGELAVKLHLAGMWLTFALAALVISWFVARISTTLRMRDTQLAQARERQMQHAQVLALAAQAAGAAHALATPLSTITLLVADLREQTGMNPALAWVEADLQLIEAQLASCRQALQQMRARQANNSAPPPLARWLQEWLDAWRLLHPHAPLELDLAADLQPAPPLSDAWAVAQILQTLLENAQQAAPGKPLMLQVRRQQLHEKAGLSFTLSDHGPGIAPELLPLLGHAPLTSSSGGQGIGLWLAVVAASQIGAELAFGARADGKPGACVRLWLSVPWEEK